MRTGCRYRLLMLVTALLALIQIGAAWRALQVPPALAEQVSLPLPLEFVGGLLWAGVFAVLTYWLVRRRRGAARLVAAVLGVFALYNGVRWLLFTRADYDSERLPVLLAAMSVFVILVGVVVWRRPQQMEKSLDDTESED
jgi:hypothetical protein